MQVEQHGWHSPRLGRGMGINVYGHYGSPILVFPTSGGDENEYAGQGMIDALAHHIDGGRVKFFCINSVNNESWYDKQAHPRHRSYVQAMYDDYIAGEVAPFIHDHCHTPGIAITTTGASFGAYHAANTLLKHPDLFQALPRPVGGLRHPALHGRRLRRQLLLQQPRRLRGEPRTLVPRTTSRQCDIRLATGHGPYEDSGPPTSCPRSWSRRASRTPWTTGAPTAATTGRTGSSR